MGINPPTAEGGLKPPHRDCAQDCLGFVSSSLGFLVKVMKISWGEKTFSLCLLPFIAVSSRGLRSPLEQEPAEQGRGGCSPALEGKQGGEGENTTGKEI